jgi:hypothetical protein
VVLGAKKRVLVHTTPSAGDKTFEGYLAHKKPEVVLELVDLVTGPDERVQLQGRVHLLREHVAFYQVIG